MTRRPFRLGALILLAAGAAGGVGFVEAGIPSPSHGVRSDLAMDLPPVFTNHPRDETVSVGEDAFFEAWADGDPPASFQWQLSSDEGLTWANLVDGTGFTGTTSFELRVNAVAMSENRSWFRLLAFNSAGVEFSDPAMLTVVIGSIPTIRQQPGNTGAIVGGTTPLVAAVDGTPAPAVQWQISNDGSHWQDLVESAVFAGVTTTTLSVTPVDVSLNGSLVRMAATNSAGTTVTTPAILTVSAQPIVPSIVQQPQDGIVPVSGTIFSVVAVGAPTPTYQWQMLTVTGWVDLQDNGNLPAPGFIVYTGSQTPTLTVVVVCCGHGPLGGPIIGMQVRVIVSNVAGAAISSSVQAVPAPVMQFDRSSLSFGATDTGAAFASRTAPQTIRMTQTGSGQLSWTAATNQPWLVVTPTSGSGPVSFSVSIKWVPGLAPAQRGTITIAFPEEAILPGGPGPLPRAQLNNISVSLSVLPATTAFPPFGAFDSPADGITGVTGSIAITGWALDAVQATRVTVCRDPSGSEIAPIDANCAGNAKIYVGDAVFIDGARPDVEAAFPAAPMNTRAGWGYLMLTNFLPNLGNGTFTFTAYAFDVAGRASSLGSKTITCNNAASAAPFGAIDVPAQGATFSGVVGNVAWVLSPGTARSDPPGGGIVHVLVDGVDQGAPNPGLWNARPDLTALFPVAQFSGISTALGIHSLDTTTLTNGVHTIFWLATGTGGTGTSGIGSRFFSVSNGDQSSVQHAAASVRGPTVVAARTALDVPGTVANRIVSAQPLAQVIAAAPADLSSLQGRRGFDLDRPLRTYTSSADRIDVQAEELDRIELRLGGASNQSYTGYLQTPAGIRPLPVGSALDASTGTFTWMPGVGFYGSYDLTFVRWSVGRAIARRNVRVTLNAKGSNRVGPQTIIDKPANDRVFTTGQAIFLSGWAADLDAQSGGGVSAVHVWAYPVDASGTRQDPIFLGPAISGVARADVAAVYGDRFLDSGYGMLVNGLAPGVYDIAVFAWSTVVNNFTPARVVRVVVR